MKKLTLIFLIFTVNLFPQELLFEKSFGNFQNATSFDIDLNLNFFVTDSDSNIVAKIDSNGNKIFQIGGYGWEESTFDEPADIFTNTLSVYVADKNNNRIQRFDKDLNFLSQYSGNDEALTAIEFAYPTCVAISPIGDLFILDSDNSRILKFDLSGKYVLEIGGNDAGNFSVSDPVYFATDNEGNLFVIDGKSIKVFDQYGNGLLKFKPVFDAERINIFNNILLLCNKNKIAIYNLKDNKLISHVEKPVNISGGEFIVDVKLIGENLFILTQKKIYKYKFTSK